MARLLVVLLLLPSPHVLAAPALETRVKTAVGKGREFLLSRFNRDKGWGEARGTGTYNDVGTPYYYPAGVTAFVAFALLKAGTPPTDKRLRRAYSILRVRHRTPPIAYEISMQLMFVAEYAGQKNSPDFRTPKLREQRTTHRFKKPADSPLKKEHWTWIADLSKKLMKFQSKAGGWRYYPNDFHSGGREDVSSTQFAMLALSTASRLGYDVPPQVFKTARAYLMSQQDKTGPIVPRAIHVPGGPADAMDRARGFAYVRSSPVPHWSRSNGGMTAAGVASMLLVREELGKDPEFEQAILDGYAWLGRYFTVRVNPGRAPFLGGSYHYTYLYALERCGDLGRREVIGGRSWFAEGARYLLAHQSEDGSFLDPTCMNPKDVLGTAFAMLFLTRASKPVSG
ncbi:MAG: prenyltransferase/squalene oxidase repeat-containing protein [Planctomycetota bacterium]|jgi:hypothetical protein